MFLHAHICAMMMLIKEQRRKTISNQPPSHINGQRRDTASLQKGEIIMTQASNKAYKVSMIGLLAALSYVVFTYGQFTAG